MSGDLFLQTVGNGVMMGAMLTTVALGLSLVFGVMRIVNLAHGEIYMLGGMGMWFLSTHLGISYSFSIVLSMIIVGGIGVSGGSPQQDGIAAQAGIAALK